MKVERLQRHHRHTEFTCSGSNNNRSQALSRSVILDLYCKLCALLCIPLFFHNVFCTLHTVRPLTVEIRSLDEENQEVFSGQNQSWSCWAYGSYPAPSVSWWIDDRYQLDSHKEVLNMHFSQSPQASSPVRSTLFSKQIWSISQHF